MTPTRVIIDTDPGVDDVFAILSALTARSENFEVLLISITHGNVGALTCLHNLVTLFSVVDRERAWRKSRGLDEGFGTNRVGAPKPVVALGAKEPILAEQALAEYYHGRDGLGGTTSSHPHIIPPENWQAFFEDISENSLEEEARALSFRPTANPGHKEILRILRESPSKTITIIAVGPLTNIALAAAEDRETFLKVKEVVVMGGAVNVPGNVTPAAEFNTYADPHAADQVFALTSPAIGLRVLLFPLDITVPHVLRKSDVVPLAAKLSAQDSPLAEWISAILGHTYERAASLAGSIDEDLGLSMHDPLCVWYTVCQSLGSHGWKFAEGSPEDIRIETDGKWTRGMCVVDRRNRNKEEGGVSGDKDGWLDTLKGNRIWRVAESPGHEAFAGWIVKSILGVD